MHLQNKTHETSWFFIVIFVILSMIFGWFVVYIDRGVVLSYSDSASTVEASGVASVAKYNLIEQQPLYVPSLAVFAPNQPWMYVSKSTPLGGSYTPEQLSDISLPTAYAEKPMQLRSDVLKKLEKLFALAEQDGYELMVSSAYRSVEDQQELYDEFVRTRGEAAANEYVLTPGASEHHTGFAVDLTDSSSECESDSDECNLSASTAQWIASNAPNFGFIVRYPSGKEPITGIAHEPWHLRYVGTVLAQQLSEAELTLDEFIEQVAPGRIK